MATDCPVCGDEAEHVRRERPRDTDPDDGALTASQTIEIDELCAGEDERWDRVCHSARLQDTGETIVPLLGVYYHHFGDGDDGA